MSILPSVSDAELRSLGPVFSHSLKDPIKQILSQCISDPDTESIRHYAQLLHDRVEALQAYHELLGIFEYSSVDLNEVMMTVWNADIQRPKEAILNIKPLPIIQGSYKQLRQLCKILLQNSVDATYGGDVIDPAASIDVSYDGESLIITDPGKGLEPYYKPIVFLPFQTLKEEKEPCSGIGLFYARRIASNHGGSIDYQSLKTGGCTFKVTLKNQAS